jgi:hypothetical protein
VGVALDDHRRLVDVSDIGRAIAQSGSRNDQIKGGMRRGCREV